MKNIKKSLFFLGVYFSTSLFCAQPAPAQSFPIYYNINSKTNPITSPNVKAIDSLNNLLDIRKNPTIKISNNFLSSIKKYASGANLKNEISIEKYNSLRGVLAGINILDAFKACLSQGNKEGEGPSSEAVITFLNRTIKNYLGDKNISLSGIRPDASLPMILNYIKQQLNSDPYHYNFKFRKAIFNYIVNKMEQKIYNSQIGTLSDDQSVNYLQEFNKHLTVTNNILEGKSTFKERCYLKITKTLFSIAHWIRTKVFRKTGIEDQNNPLSTILNFESINTDFISMLAKQHEKTFLDDNTMNEEFKTQEIESDNSSDQNKEIFNFTINKKSITIKSEEHFIYSSFIQKKLAAGGNGYPYGAMTQTIYNNHEEEIVSHTFKVNSKINIPNIEDEAKKYILNSLDSLSRTEIQSAEEAITLLSKNIIEKNRTDNTNTDASINTNVGMLLTDSSVQVFNSTHVENAVEIITANENIAGMTLFIENQDNEFFHSIIDSSSNDQFVDFDVQSISSAQSYVTADSKSLSNQDFLSMAESLTNTLSEEKAIIETAAIATLETMKSSLKNISATDMLNTNKFNFDEAVKYLDFVSSIKNHLDMLSTKATSYSDERAIQDCISRLNTAFANRQPELSEEEKQKYKRLKEELDQFITTGSLETNEKFYKWVQNLYDTDINQFNLIKNDIDSAVFKENIKLYNGQLANDLTINELIELKNIFGDFIMGAENYGYGTLEFLNNPATSYEEKNYQDILIKAGINSPKQQQQLFDNLITIDKRLQNKLLEEYNKQGSDTSAKNAFINTLAEGALTNNDYVNAFNALSNESKINFINNLPNNDNDNDLTTQQRNEAISVTLQKTIDSAITESAILTLQKDMFARGDVVLQALQDKIKTVLTNKYKDLPTSDQSNFKRSMLDPQDFTDYSRAFKILSLSDQKSIAADLKIDDNELKKFQKILLADKIFYAKTIDELNQLKADINKFNNADNTYFTNQDLGGKHGLTLIGTAFTQKTQDLIAQRIHDNALFTDTQNGTDYFVNSLLDFKSQDPYASAFRQLSLLKQNEIAQTLNLQDDSINKNLTNFKKFMTKALTDQANMLTDSVDLNYLRDDANTLLTNRIITNITFENIQKRANQAQSQTLQEIKPEGRSVTFDPNSFVAGTPSTDGQDIKPIDPKIPTAADIKTQFDSQTLPRDFSVDKNSDEKQKAEDEAEYRREQIAQETERAAQEQAAKDTHTNDHENK